MTPDLTPQIDAALDRMEHLLAKMKSQGKKPATAKQTRLLFETAVSSLEDSQQGTEKAPLPEGMTREGAVEDLKSKPKPVAKTVSPRLLGIGRWLGPSGIASLVHTSEDEG